MLLQNIKLALASMKGGKMRTLLSLLGIIIGVSSVVTILNLGNSASDSITGSLTSSGYDMLYLTTFGTTKVRENFDELFGNELMANVEGIEIVMPTVSGSARLRYENETTSASVQGVYSDYAANNSYVPEIGRASCRERVSVGV